MVRVTEVGVCALRAVAMLCYVAQKRIVSWEAGFFARMGRLRSLGW